MPKVLLIDPTPSPLVERLRPLFPAGADLDVVPTSSEEDLAQHGAEAEILLVLHRKVDVRLLSFVPRVRLVQVVSVGYDNLDLGALQAAGVVAAYTPGANAVAVAEQRQPCCCRASVTDGDRQRRALPPWRVSARPGPFASAC